MEDLKEFYETSDLGVMAVLNLKGIKPRDFRSEGKKKFAIYDNTQELEAVVNDYLLGTLMVDAKSYNQAIKETKYMIFNVA